MSNIQLDISSAKMWITTFFFYTLTTPIYLITFASVLLPTYVLAQEWREEIEEIIENENRDIKQKNDQDAR